MKSTSSLITPTLKLLAYSALGATALIEASSGSPSDAIAQIATLKIAGTLAGEVSGGLLYELLFGDKKSLPHKTIIDVAGEAIGRSLTNIADSLRQRQPDNAGLEKLGEFIERHGLKHLHNRWHSFVTGQISPQLAKLSSLEIERHLNDGELLEAGDLKQLVAMLTTDEQDEESYLDDKTLQQVSFCLLQTLPASFNDVLTDEHSGKVYRRRMHEMLGEQGRKLDTILSVLHQLQEHSIQSVTPPLPQDKIEIARLPRLLTSDLFGRERELQMLNDAWANPQTNVISFVAWGGMGKSALVSRWLQVLEQDHWRGAERVFAWSFYSQGTSDKSATAEYFINTALRWFGGDALADQLQKAGQWEKGERLAQLIRQTRTLLILDGLEPVQHPPMSAMQADVPEGGLKEQTMQALLRELASHQPGLCVITTRAGIADLTRFEGRSVVRHPLNELSPPAGAQLLRQLKVNGLPEEMETAAREYDGHALALTLLGSYLADVYAGDVRRRHEIENLENDRKHGWQARRMFRAYEKWLGESGQNAMLDLLRMLGLFDRPADGKAIEALRSAPAITGLTDSLQALNAREWQQTLAALRDLHLLAEASPNDPDTLVAHRLVREHFGELLQRVYPEAWKAGNLRLYEHLTRTATKLPDTIEEMTPLFAAVAHGCKAGRHQEAFEDVYWQRIRRMEEAFSIKVLGAFGYDLAMVSLFFETHWQRTVAGLTEEVKVFLLNAAGFHLRALGLLKEAEQPLEMALKSCILIRDWHNASRAAANLCELNLTAGNIANAQSLAEQSLELCERGVSNNDDLSKIIRSLELSSLLACVLHQGGDLRRAHETFRRAEASYKSFMNSLLPPDSLISSLPDSLTSPFSLAAFQYCDLLLEQGKYEEVRKRASRSLEWGRKSGILLDIGLSNLSLGKAGLLQAKKQASKKGIRIPNQAVEFLENAVDKLRQSERQDYFPSGLLARAELYRLTKDFQRSQDDLEYARRIATRGLMRLHLADYHLESARLALAKLSSTWGVSDLGLAEKGDSRATDRSSSSYSSEDLLVEAQKHFKIAQAMIEEMGYHRRDSELAEIEVQLQRDA